MKYRANYYNGKGILNTPLEGTNKKKLLLQIEELATLATEWGDTVQYYVYDENYKTVYLRIMRKSRIQKCIENYKYVF